MGVYRPGVTEGTYELQPVNMPVVDGLFRLRADDELDGGVFALELVGPTAPIPSPFVSMDPQPRVELLFDSLPAEAVFARVVQISSEGERTVRTDTVGGVVYAAGGFTVTDYEPPLGVPVTYRAMQYNAAGSELGWTDSATVRLDIDPSMVVVSDPLSPGVAVMVEAKDDFGSRASVSRQVSLVRIGFDTVALMGSAGLASDVPVSVQTKTLADAAQLVRVLRNGYVLVRSMPAPLPLFPRNLHAVIPVVDPVPVDVHWGGEWVLFPLVGQEVTRSELPIVEPTVTWDQVVAAYPTWDALLAAHSTWLDLLSDPPSAA